MNKKVGYGRMPATWPEWSEQREALLSANCQERDLYLEQNNQQIRTSPKLKLCLGRLRSGDTLVVLRLDRLVRTYPKFVQLGALLRKMGVAIEILDPPLLFDESPAGVVRFEMLHVYSDFLTTVSKQEALHKENYSRSPLVTKNMGRSPSLSTAQIDQIKLRRLESKVSIAALAREYNCSRATMQKFVGNRKDVVK